MIVFLVRYMTKQEQDAAIERLRQKKLAKRAFKSIPPPMLIPPKVVLDLPSIEIPKEEK